jgi:undecaprenyl-diphosphooligosaccharide--protein glycosyltransferase
LRLPKSQHSSTAPRSEGFLLPSKAELLVIILLTYLVACLFRLLELPQWALPLLNIQGEPLMVAHDAYYWLAGAKEINEATGHPLSETLRLLHFLTGQPLAEIGFWLPVIVAPLAVIPVCILVRNWKMPEAGLVAGILAASSVGFLVRTRLGYLDTDLGALFFPAALAMGFILWLTPLCRETWRCPRERQNAADQPLDFRRILLGALGIGFLVNLYLWFYGSGQPIVLALCGMAMLAGLFLCRTGQHTPLLSAFAIIFIGWLAGWPGFMVAAAMTIAFIRMPGWLDHYRVCIALWTLIGFYLALSGQYLDLFFSVIGRISTYARTATALSDASLDFLKVPHGMESNREAFIIPLDIIVGGMLGHWIYFILGLIGFGWLTWKRPLAILFLPFVLLSLASVKLGNRFTMYAGLPWGLGLGCGLSLLMERLSQSKPRRYFVMAVLALLISFPIWDVAGTMTPTPVLSKTYAETLTELKARSKPDAELWQWWDYGYAAQYYAERITFGDGGGRMFGFWLYPAALVHATSSPLQARQMMLFMAKTRMEEERILKANKEVNTRAKFPLYSIDPSLPFRALKPEELGDLLARLANEPRKWPLGMREQYLTLSWENLPLAGFISYYANWDFATGQGRSDWIRKVSGKMNIDRASGILTEDNQDYSLLSLDILNGTGRSRFTWPHAQGVHAIVNELTGEIYLMGNRIYSSMMIRMLIDDPRSFADHFEIVVDHFPLARSYRVKYP